MKKQSNKINRLRRHQKSAITRNLAESIMREREKYSQSIFSETAGTPSMKKKFIEDTENLYEEPFHEEPHTRCESQCIGSLASLPPTPISPSASAKRSRESLADPRNFLTRKPNSESVQTLSGVILSRVEKHQAQALLNSKAHEISNQLLDHLGVVRNPRWFGNLLRDLSNHFNLPLPEGIKPVKGVRS